MADGALSSGSWQEERRPRGDIIDLDELMMRGTHSPSRSQRRERERLVVDAGGGRKPARAPPAPRSPPTPRSSCSSSPVPRAPPRRHPPASHNKRFSHDSGLSDGSYLRRRRRRSATASRECVESPSLHAFRSQCERALRDQQAQISRVAALCEKALTQASPPPPTHPPASSSGATTDLTTSTSRSIKQRDKRKVNECKTYKIIMTKLDELQRLYAANQRRAAATPRRTPAIPRLSTSYTVTEKLVGTEPARQHATKCAAEAGVRLVSEKAVGSTACVQPTPPASVRPPATCRVCHVSGGRLLANHGDHTERGAASDGGSSVCRFDLNDPVHLYAQAKRLNALHAELSARGSGGGARTVGGARPGGGGSVCGWCRGYWARLRSSGTALCQQLFCQPEMPT